MRNEKFTFGQTSRRPSTLAFLCSLLSLFCVISRQSCCCCCLHGLHRFNHKPESRTSLLIDLSKGEKRTVMRGSHETYRENLMKSFGGNLSWPQNASSPSPSFELVIITDIIFFTPHRLLVLLLLETVLGKKLWTRVDRCRFTSCLPLFCCYFFFHCGVCGLIWDFCFNGFLRYIIFWSDWSAPINRSVSRVSIHSK